MKKHFNAIQRHVDANGYTCGDVVQVYKNGEMAAARTSGAGEEEEPLLFCREAHVCGTSVEAQYYDLEGYTERGEGQHKACLLPLICRQPPCEGQGRDGIGGEARAGLLAHV